MEMISVLQVIDYGIIGAQKSPSRLGKQITTLYTTQSGPTAIQGVLPMCG